MTGSSSGELTSTFTGTDHSSDEQQDSSWFYDVWSYLITLNAILITPLLFFIILSAYFFMVSSLFLLVFAGIKYCWPASWKTKLQGLPTQFVLQGISLLVTVVSGSLLLYKFRSLFWQTGRGQGRTAEDEFIEYCKKYVQVRRFPLLTTAPRDTNHLQRLVIQIGLPVVRLSRCLVRLNPAPVATFSSKSPKFTRFYTFSPWPTLFGLQ